MTTEPLAVNIFLAATLISGVVFAVVAAWAYFQTPKNRRKNDG